MCGFIAQLVEHRTGIAKVTGSNPVEALFFFFQASSFQLLKLEINCDDHPSLSFYFENVMTKFIVNNRTDSLKTDVNLFLTKTNCRIARSRSLTRRMNFKFMCLSAY